MEHKDSIRQGSESIAGATVKQAALVLGLDSHGLAIVHALADAGVKVYALEKDLTLPGVSTRRVVKTFYTRDFSEQHLMHALYEARSHFSACCEVDLIAVNDRQVEIIGRHVKQLRTLFKISWADGASAILKLQRKDSLEEWSREQGLAYPRSLVFFHVGQRQHAAALRYPVIIKPIQPLSSFKTLMAHDPSELGQYLWEYADALPILAQEYVAGGDEQIFFGALMLERGKVLHSMVGRKLASYPPARGQTKIAETMDDFRVSRLTKRFFRGLDLSGPVSLELKRDPEEKYWVIEPTVGRTDFWVKLCVSAGFNQPMMEYELALGLPVTLPPMQRKCVWYNTERDPMAYFRLCWRQKTLRPRGKRQVFSYLRMNEWRPFWIAFMSACARQVWTH